MLYGFLWEKLVSFALWDFLPGLGLKKKSNPQVALRDPTLFERFILCMTWKSHATLNFDDGVLGLTIEI